MTVPNLRAVRSSRCCDNCRPKQEPLQSGLPEGVLALQYPNQGEGAPEARGSGSPGSVSSEGSQWNSNVRAELRMDGVFAVPSSERVRYLARLGVVKESPMKPSTNPEGAPGSLGTAHTDLAGSSVSHDDYDLGLERQSSSEWRGLGEALHADVDTNIQQFDLVSEIGKGSFGVVTKAVHLATGDVFAIKILSKASLMERHAVRYVKREWRVLEKASSPFVVKLHKGFTDSNYFYFVLEFCPGGDLAYHLDCDENNRFSEERAQFYAAELVLAIAFLHSLGVIYRDLKPDNVLLDAKGHVRVADFGLCKEGIGPTGKSHSFCGSPAYLSPEMLAGTGHGHALDWYGLGILIFEMLSGLPPFYSRDRNKMWSDIRHRPLSAGALATFSGPAASLLSALLEKDEEKRLGSVPGAQGSQAVKTHPFFHGIDWNSIEAREVPPPFIPTDASEDSGADGDFGELGGLG